LRQIRELERVGDEPIDSRRGEIRRRRERHPLSLHDAHSDRAMSGFFDQLGLT
jgi:hypothetical protein